MAEMVSIKDATVNEWKDVPTGKLRLSTYLAAPKESRDPQFFTVDNTPHRHLPTHFHDSDQFQIIVQGTGTLGRHELKPFTVHYSRAFTPYGPIQAGPEGVTWATLRSKSSSTGWSATNAGATCSPGNRPSRATRARWPLPCAMPAGC